MRGAHATRLRRVRVFARSGWQLRDVARGRDSVESCGESEVDDGGRCAAGPPPGDSLGSSTDRDRMATLLRRGSSSEPLAETGSGPGAASAQRIVRPLEQTSARGARAFKGGLEFPADHGRDHSTSSSAWGHDPDRGATSRAGRRGIPRLFAMRISSLNGRTRWCIGSSSNAPAACHPRRRARSAVGGSSPERRAAVRLGHDAPQTTLGLAVVDGLMLQLTERGHASRAARSSVQRRNYTKTTTAL